MKQLAITMITGYQTFISLPFRMLLGITDVCRHEESCSAYAKRVIGERGLLTGGFFAGKRVFSCRPY